MRSGRKGEGGAPGYGHCANSARHPPTSRALACGQALRFATKRRRCSRVVRFHAANEGLRVVAREFSTPLQREAPATSSIRLSANARVEFIMSMNCIVLTCGVRSAKTVHTRALSNPSSTGHAERINRGRNFILYKHRREIVGAYRRSVYISQNSVGIDAYGSKRALHISVKNRKLFLPGRGLPSSSAREKVWISVKLYIYVIQHTTHRRDSIGVTPRKKILRLSSRAFENSYL